MDRAFQIPCFEGLRVSLPGPRAKPSARMRKGGFRRPFASNLYSHFTKLDGFTMPGFEIFYFGSNEYFGRFLEGLGA
jgi:hypothetical protein